MLVLSVADSELLTNLGFAAAGVIAARIPCRLRLLRLCLLRLGLRYSESQLYKDVEERRIPFIQKGRRVLFLKTDLIEWLQTMRKPAIN